MGELDLNQGVACIMASLSLIVAVGEVATEVVKWVFGAIVWRTLKGLRVPNRPYVSGRHASAWSLVHMQSHRTYFSDYTSWTGWPLSKRLRPNAYSAHPRQTTTVNYLDPLILQFLSIRHPD